MTFLAKSATILCMVTRSFMTQSGHAEHICLPWSFVLIHTINTAFTILFPDSWGWSMAVFRPLFVLFTFPEGIFLCQPYWLTAPSQWLTLLSECADSFMAHGTLGTFPAAFTLFPLVFLLAFKERRLNLLSSFDFDRVTTLESRFQTLHPCLDCLTVAGSRHLAGADWCCYLSVGCVSCLCLWVIVLTSPHTRAYEKGSVRFWSCWWYTVMSISVL